MPVLAVSFLRSLLEVFATMSPMFAILLERIPLRSTLLNVGTLASLISVLVGFMIYQPFSEYSSPLRPYTNVMVLYLAAMVLFFIFFWKRYGSQGYTKSLALTLCAGFVMSELHDIPIWTLNYLGIYDTWGSYAGDTVWFTPLNQGYFLIALLYFLDLGDVNWREAKWILAVGTLFQFLVYPLGAFDYPLWSYVKRLVWIPAFLYLFRRKVEYFSMDYVRAVTPWIETFREGRWVPLHPATDKQLRELWHLT